jgi:hypothetical protein
MGSLVILPVKHVLRAFDPKNRAHTPGLILTYLAILGHVNTKSGQAHPSQLRLGAILGYSQRQVSRNVHKLKSMGLIEIKIRPLSGGKRQFIYTPKFEQSMRIDPRAVIHRPNSGSPYGHDERPQGKAQLSTGNRVLDAIAEKECSPCGHPGCPEPLRTSSVSVERSLTKSLRRGVSANEVIDAWIREAQRAEVEVVANEDDLAIAHKLEERLAGEGEVVRAMREHYADVIAWSIDAHVRLEPLVCRLLTESKS